MTTNEKIEALKQYALDNYTKGGEWVYECFDDEIYAEFLDDENGNLKKAKRALRSYWEIIDERSAAARANVF